MLKGKTVITGICGGIAAYKVVDVVSRLRKKEAEVHVIMTENATKFVTPLTFQSISHNQVITDMFAEPLNWDIKHISLAEKADLIVVAPATANIIGKVANGIADDMLTTTIMATKAKVMFIPAMNHNMYENPIVQDNIARLRKFGYSFVEPDTGLMACGTSGKGRLPEPEVIVEQIEKVLYEKKDMEGLRVLVTAGPTREAIDPVRYISNNSSGKMGYAFAETALKRGAEVTVISGPVQVRKPSGIDIIDVETADEMYREVISQYGNYDIIVLVAAVADYKCARVSDKKIKKKENEMFLELSKNPDIAKELGKIKGDKIVIGSCAETDNLISNARAKLKSKNFDIIMANDVTMEGAGFGTDTNIVTVISSDGTMKELPIMNKEDVADQILDDAVNMIRKKKSF